MAITRYSKIYLILYIQFIIIQASFGQNCGQISGWSYTQSTVGSNTTYTINFDALSTSGGSKSITNLVLRCGSTVINTNSTCYATNPSSGAPVSYSYPVGPVSTCGSNLTLTYNGHTNSACGGTTCAVGTSAPPPSSVPVSWLTQDAQVIDKSVVISWSTASELNNEKFEVYRTRNDDTEEVLIGEVRGAGNSQSVEYYTFIDNSVESNQGYCYGIKQVDFDGKYDFSDVICVLQERKQDPIKVTPNPFSNELIIQALDLENTQEVLVMSSQGEVVLMSSISLDGKLVMDTKFLEPGSYFLKVGGIMKKLIKL